MSLARTQAAIVAERREAVLVGSLSLLAACLVLGAILRTVIRPITSLTRVMVELSDGNSTVDIPLLTRADQLGAMARTVEVFKRNAATVQRLRAERAEEAKRVEAVRRELLHTMANTFQRDVAARLDHVLTTANGSQAIALTMVARIEESEAGAGSVAVMTAQTAESVEGVAAAGLQMSASTDEIAGRVASNAGCARVAAEASVIAGQTIANLADEARRIGSVVAAIQAIAQQTKLLSLNASIEAARAGASGRGFAVVANEIKSLAAQTADETRRIAQQIGAMQMASRNVVTEICAIAEASERSNVLAAEIASAMDEQSVAMRQIARNVSTASEGTSSVARTIGTVSGAIGVVREAARTILTANTELSGQVAELQANVQRFVSDVRAA